MLRFWGLLLCLLGLSAQAAGGTAITVVTEDFAPYNYPGPNGITGYATEVVRAAVINAGMEYSVHVYPWARAYLYATKHPNVLIHSIVRTPEREALFHWLAPIAPRSMYLYKLAAREDIRIKTVEDLKPYRIAAIRGDIVEEQLNKLGLHGDLASQDETGLRKLEIGRVDLIVASEPSIQSVCVNAKISCALLERTIPMPGMNDYYVAASLQTPPATVQALRTELEKLRSSGFMQRTAEKYGLSLK